MVFYQGLGQICIHIWRNVAKKKGLKRPGNVDRNAFLISLHVVTPALVLLIYHPYRPGQMLTAGVSGGRSVMFANFFL